MLRLQKYAKKADTATNVCLRWGGGWLISTQGQG